MTEKWNSVHAETYEVIFGGIPSVIEVGSPTKPSRVVISLKLQVFNNAWFGQELPRINANHSVRRTNNPHVSKQNNPSAESTTYNRRKAP